MQIKQKDMFDLLRLKLWPWLYSRLRTNNGDFLLTCYDLDYALKTNTWAMEDIVGKNPCHVHSSCSVFNISCAVSTTKANQLPQITAQVLWISSSELLFFNTCRRIFNHASVTHTVFTFTQLVVKPTFEQLAPHLGQCAWERSGCAERQAAGCEVSHSTE